MVEESEEDFGDDEIDSGILDGEYDDDDDDDDMIDSGIMEDSDDYSEEEIIDSGIMENEGGNLSIYRNQMIFFLLTCIYYEYFATL